MAVTGTKKTIPLDSIIEYREIPKLNCSSIKIFEKEGVQQFYKQVILKEKPKKREEDEEKASLIVGNVLDFMRTDCRGELQEFENRYDERFLLFNGIKSDNQVFMLADELFRLTKECMNDEGMITTELSDRFEAAFTNMQSKDKFKGKTLEKAWELFSAEPTEKELEKNSNLTSAYFYFQEKMKGIGKQTVDLYHLDVAKRLLEQSNVDEFVYDIFHTDLETQNKLVIEWEYLTKENFAIPCKIEIDLALWDYDNKIVHPKDVKTVFDNRREQVRRQYYGYLYGWQGAFYTLGLRWWLDNNRMEDWEIAPFEFVFFSTGNSNRPNRLEMTDEMQEEAINGSFDGYRKTKGLFQCLEEIGWHEQTGIYNTEMEAYLNNGKIKFI